MVDDETRERSDEVAGASWQADPFGRDQSRFWDGERWTSRVRVRGEGAIVPPVVDPAPPKAPLHEPATPITDAVRPLSLRASKLPIAMALALVVMAAIVVLIGYGIYSLIAG